MIVFRVPFDEIRGAQIECDAQFSLAYAAFISLRRENVDRDELKKLQLEIASYRLELAASGGKVPEDPKLDAALEDCKKVEETESMHNFAVTAISERLFAYCVACFLCDAAALTVPAAARSEP